MAPGRPVVVNGDLGSGKTTVSVLLAQRLGIRRVSIGDLYRDLASQRGVTALQLNLHAELDDKIDHYVDNLQRDIAASGEQLVVDSRLAWHFFATR
jgi:cytidylate kinase